MENSGLTVLTKGLSDPSWADFFYFSSLYYIIAVIILCCFIPFRRRAHEALPLPGSTLTLPALVSIAVGASIPLIYRMWPSSAPSLCWECDSVLLFFSAFSDNQSLWDFTRYAVLFKPGVLAASAHTLFWGVPTFAILTWVSWTNFSFLSISLLLGTASVLIGSLIVRLLFSSGVALCFIIIFAVNPALVFNMGYGVAQTGTLFALLLAILFTFRALMGKGLVWINVPLAIVFLFGATLNYGPGRVFVVATLIFLAGVVLAALLWRRLPKKLALTALVLLVGATTVLVAENRANRRTDFTSMRGEHALHQELVNQHLKTILSDTPEMRILDPLNLPILLRARFLLGYAWLGFKQFEYSFSPFTRLDMQRRGLSVGNESSPYQSGLIIFIAVGVWLSVSNIVRAFLNRSSHKSLNHAFILSLFLLGLGPLLLVNRLDQHRSFLLIYPLTVLAALGMWTCMQQMYKRGMPRSIVGFLGLAVSISLSASTWWRFGVQEHMNPNLSAAISRFTATDPPAVVLGSAGLICQDLAPVQFAMVNLAKAHPDISQKFIPVRFLNALADETFDGQQAQFESYMRMFGSQRVAFVSGLPMTKFEQTLRSRGMSVQKSEFGNFSTWVIEPQRVGQENPKTPPAT